MNKKILAAVLAALSAGAWAAEPLNVVSSFSILGDVAKQIGGDKVAVSNLVGFDQDTHAYHLTSGDIKKLRSAKLVLLNGLGLENGDVVRAVKQGKLNYAEAAAGIKAMSADSHHEHSHDHHDHDHGHYDPHVWQDPVLMKQYAANVAAALSKTDPANQTYYRQRLNAYTQELVKLDNYAKTKFNAVPAAKRKVLTGHDAFAYMGKRYGIRFIAPQGVSSEAEPSAKQVAAIIRQMKAQKISAVFAENIKDTRMVSRIAKETGSKVGGKLYSDALSRSNGAGSYIGMYRYNVDVLSAAMK
ncbi:MAG: zinc ABC transporter substrate-binding protein [Neisseria sp.]|nr:zinc ABC transporter substrate-binding protein [Neisseria sp.]